MILSFLAALTIAHSGAPPRHLKVIWVDSNSEAYKQGLRTNDQIADSKMSLARLFYRCGYGPNQKVAFQHPVGSPIDITVKRRDFRDFILGYSPGGLVNSYEQQLILDQTRYGLLSLRREVLDAWKLFDAETDPQVRDWLLASQSVYHSTWLTLGGTDATSETSTGFNFHTDGPSLTRLRRCSDDATKAFYLLRYTNPHLGPGFRPQDLPEVDEVIKKLMDPLDADGCTSEELGLALQMAYQYAAVHSNRADAWFQTAIAKSAGRADYQLRSMLGYARFLHAEHRETEADAAFRRYITATKDVPAFIMFGYAQYAGYLHEIGRDADAEAQLRLGLRVNSNGVWGFTFRSELATCIFAQGRLADALPLFEESIDKAPLMYEDGRDYSVIVDMAKGAVACRLALNDADGAIATGKRALTRVEGETDPAFGLYDYTACTSLIAQAYAAKGNFALALDTLQIAIERVGALSGDKAKLAPAYYVPLYTAKGDVLFAAKDLPGAKVAYSLALQYAEEAKKNKLLNRDPTTEPEKKLRTIDAPTPSLNRATSVTTPAQPGESFAKGKRFALLIGTDHYKDRAFPKLNNPISDAKAMKAVLDKSFKFQTKVLEDPTTGQILDALVELRDKAYGPADELLIFFAGHGTFDRVVFKDGMLVCADSKKDDKAYRSYINFKLLNKLVNELPCPHILLMLDVCFGGTFDQDISKEAEASRSSDEGQDNDTVLTQSVRWTTRLFLTSGGNEPVSDGRPGQHSPFVRKLLQTFRMDGSRKPFLSFEDLLGPLQRIKETQPIYGKFGHGHPGGRFFFVRN